MKRGKRSERKNDNKPIVQFMVQVQLPTVETINISSYEREETKAQRFASTVDPNRGIFMVTTKYLTSNVLCLIRVYKNDQNCEYH